LATILLFELQARLGTYFDPFRDTNIVVDGVAESGSKARFA
jgi:hypothetical protein